MEICGEKKKEFLMCGQSQNEDDMAGGPFAEGLLITADPDCTHGTCESAANVQLNVWRGDPIRLTASS